MALVASLNATAMADELEQDALVGWNSTPNERGTIDIIWVCFTTTFLSLYSMQHLNVPATDDGWWNLLFRRLRWLYLALLAPELFMLVAAGQWASARRSVRDMNKEKMEKNVAKSWTMVHAFYADSGGFLLQPLDEYPDFPVTAKQLHFLVQNGYIDYPAISKEDIWDKSKADRFAKSITCFQIVWLVIQVVARAIQKLYITPLELSTCALSLCTMGTFYFWLRKPLDVQRPTVIQAKVPIQQILLNAGRRLEDDIIFGTPLDFVEPDIYVTRSWHGWLRRLIVRSGLQQDFLKRIPNDRDPQLHSFSLYFCCAILTASFACIHMCGWNFPFPSYTEKLIWRITSASLIVVLGLYGFGEMFGAHLEGYQKSGLKTMRSYKKKFPQNLLFLFPAVFYFMIRVLMLWETVFSLRKLPSGAFITVEWTDFFPHFG